jgi:hypothetical protein
LSTITSASSGGEDLGGPVGADEDGIEPALLDPGSSQALVFTGHHQPALGERTVIEKALGCRRHDAHRVETGVEEFHQVGLLLGDPVGAGEPHVTGARCQHLNDVLRL